MFEWSEKMKYFIGFFRKCDLLTMLGTSLAFLGIYLACEDHFTVAVFCLLLCGICDSFDGTLARKYKYSKEAQEYGVQLDSLSDVICFGVLPAVITMLVTKSYISVLIGIFFMLCGVVRLAYFNMLHTTNNAKKGVYIGVPITAIAIVYPIIFIIIKYISFDILKIVMPILLIIMGVLEISKINIKKPNVSKIASKIFNKYVVNLVIFPLFIVVFGDLFYRFNLNDGFNAINDTLAVCLKHIPALLLVYLCVLSIYLLISSIFKKGKISKIILLIIFLILFVVNDIKFNIMGIPLELSDVNYLNADNVSMMGTAAGTIGSWIWYTIIKAVVYIIVGIILVYIDKWRGIKLENRLIRIGCFVGSIIVFTLIILGFRYETNFIIKYIYNTDKEVIDKYNSVVDYSNNYGLLQGIILCGISKTDFTPSEYDRKEATEILASYNSEDNDKSWGKANVVFILSEAFSDLERIDEVEFNKPLMKEINDYKKDNNKMVLDLIVPTKGGVSVNTEFEVLTGASLSFWSLGYIPYNQYYNNVSGAMAPNIIKEFNNNGYDTMYLTPWGSASYNSARNYELFGAKETVYGVSLNGKNKGTFYSDKSFMEDIYNQLKDTSVGNYKFIMSATGQNHFPYTSDKYKENELDIKVTKSDFSDESNILLRNYAQGLYDASKELNNLYNKIQELDVPTIVVFYGDHLPYMVDSNGIDPYMESSYFNTNDEKLNNIRKYTTKVVILSNYDIETDDIKYMNASYLGAYILNKMDLNISNYFKFIDDTRKKVSAFNRQGIYLGDRVVDFDDMNNSVKLTINNYKNVQYGSFYENVK